LVQWILGCANVPIDLPIAERVCATNMSADNLSNYPPHSHLVLQKDLELTHKLMNNENVDSEIFTNILKSKKRKRK